MSGQNRSLEAGFLQRPRVGALSTSRWLRVLLLTLAFGWQIVPRAAAGQSAEVQHLFQVGNERYQSGKYQEAIEAYEKILGLGYESPELYYNLGNAYYRLNRIGKAVLNYERGLRLDPKDEDIRHNLQIASLRVVDKVPQVPELFFVKWYGKARDFLSLDQWTALVLVFYALGCALLTVRILSKWPRVRIWASRLLAVVVLFFLVAGLFWAGSLRADRKVRAVVLVEKVDVRSAPEADATEVFPLHEGTRVEIRKRVGEWCEIRLPDGKVGWMRSDMLEVI